MMWYLMRLSEIILIPFAVLLVGAALDVWEGFSETAEPNRPD